MHTVWKGTLRIAKLQIPIKLYSANEDKEISFKQLHRDCNHSVSHLKFCTQCNTSLDKSQIQRAYDLGGGHFVEVTDEDLKPAQSTADRCMMLDHFVHASEIDPIYMKKHYYVGPEQVGQQAFQLLKKCLSKNSQVGIGYITLRSTEYLAAVRATNEGIALSTLYFADEVRPVKLIQGYDEALHEAVSEQALVAIDQLVSTLTVRFDHNQYKNRHHDQLIKVINSKINNQVIPYEKPIQKANDEEESVVDVVAAIQRSIESVSSMMNTYPAHDGLH